MSVPSISALGAIEVVIGDRTLGPRDLGGPKPKQIFEILLVHDGQPVPKDRIADQLWGEALPQDWRRTLEAYISTIRANLGAEGRNLIVTEPNAYRLALERVALDAHRFGDLIDVAGTQTSGERAATLDEAITLVRDDFLADEPYVAWVAPMRTLYRERLLGALLDAAEAHIEARSVEQALAYAERVIGEQPTRERAYRVAMRAHTAQSERGLALLDYDRCRKALREHLGVDPSPDTERVYLDILNEQPMSVTGAVAAAHPVPGRTSYARSKNVSIAYMIVGEGPPDLVLAKGFVSHVEACWEWPAYGNFLHRLASRARLILFDKRGTGMSDPVAELSTLEERSDDLRAVLDAAGSGRAVVMGLSEGGPLAIQFAVAHPERVAGIILYGTFARLLRDQSYPHGWPDGFLRAFLDSLDAVWATGVGGEIANPSASDDEEFREWVGRYFRLSASPAMARALMRMNAEIDVRDLLPRVSAPTLVLHRVDEKWVRPENARYLAEHIPGARLVELPGADHWPWMGDTEPVLTEIERFLEQIGQA